MGFFLQDEPINCNLDGSLILILFVYFMGWTFYKTTHLFPDDGGISE